MSAATLPLKLSRAFLQEAAPVLDDARNYDAEADWQLAALRPVVAKIDAAKADRRGDLVILVTLEEAIVVEEEAEYRAGQCRDRASCEYRGERMALLSWARSCAVVAERARSTFKD